MRQPGCVHLTVRIGFRYQKISSNPNATSNGISSFALRCKIIDNLGNEGDLSWKNGTVDLQQPTVSSSLISSSVISENSTFSISCYDVNSCFLTGVSIRFQVGTTISWHNLALNGSNATIQISSVLSASTQVQSNLHHCSGFTG